VSSLRNTGVARIMFHRLLLMLGRTSKHPFGSRRAIEQHVHYAYADFVAEVMGTLGVLGRPLTHR
jgi:hypothetical protein